MYAIIRDGGHQYRVAEGESVLVQLRRETRNGDPVEFADVLLVAGEAGVLIGTPAVAGARVKGTVCGEVKGEKVFHLRYRRRKDSRKRVGHRQRYTRVKIKAIEIP
ncbi:MAG: 50S ribosomal protein L21 [Planctomycetes bacterium]|nr:50S ribosomal protein L21 [Planctomycetota bacterium]